MNILPDERIPILKKNVAHILNILEKKCGSGETAATISMDT